MHSTVSDPSPPTWSDVFSSADAWMPEASGVLVVVPHPDDEAVMFGGLVSLAARRGIPVHLLAVTDGGAAYPHRIGSDHLAELRLAEQAAAVAELGLAGSDVTRIGLRDGNVAGHEDDLVDAIVERLEADDVDLLVAPWKHDHHTDHEACGRAAERAAHVANRPITTAWGLFWSLLRNDPPPGLRISAIDLTTWEMRHKRSAIDCHASQISTLIADQPVLGTSELAIARSTREHYIVTVP